MDEMPYFIPMADAGLLGQWSPDSGEDEAFFNSLPEDAQQSLLAGCAGSQEFHARVREARLSQ